MLLKEKIHKLFTNGLGDWGSILGWVIPKTQKIVLDAVFHNTQHYKVSWWVVGGYFLIL